ncbi:hypothetical protein OG218_16530 [Kineococcus sp. NBC_00420]|uniref:hypothetical protein n=1 Tax=unclassified Kineococcus TaxID=2621656 RepID=UPI002E229C71
MSEPTNLHRGPAVPLLWAVLTVAVLLNVLASAGVLPLAVGIACGLVTLGCATALVVARVRRR